MAWSGLSFDEVDKKVDNSFNTDYNDLGVIINNESRYSLEYSNSGYSSGFNAKPVMEMFGQSL